MAKRLVEETSLVEDFAAAPVYTDEMLGRIACPLLAYYGENSEARVFGERLAKILPRCELRIIPGGSHVILWEGAAQLRKEIPAWLKQKSTMTV
jgi:pimeloyl-ACP methyl ester carboxylesterase